MPDPSLLNKDQLKAIKHDEGPLLIIAGAGTGKTTVITKRIEELITSKGVDPSHILALTFTEKAAGEMETRVDEALPYGYSSLWIETFHAFCDRILRTEAINIGLDPAYELMTEAETLMFLKKNIFQFELNYFRPLGNPLKFLQGMLGHFSRLKDDDTSPDQYLKYAQKLAERSEVDQEEVLRTTELAKAFFQYEEMKAREGMMDFSDLISNTLKLFRTRKNILRKYQHQFQYILVDEFQDTNYAQNEMAILLAGEKQNIAVVGDDDQSIYRFRGAALSNMLQFRAHFPKAKVVTLTKNYRSTQTILDSAYKLIQHNNPDRLEAREGIDKKLIASRPVQGNEVKFIFAERGEGEAEQVAKTIKEEAEKTGYKYNDFAILVRANDHALPFQKSLERLRIPFQFLGPSHLYDQQEIKDLIAYLKVLADFNDDSSFYRVITMPIFAVTARDIASLLSFGKKNNISVFEAIEQKDQINLTSDGIKKLAQIEDMLNKHLSLVSTETAGQILYYFFEDSGLLGYYLDPQSPKTEREAQNVAKFFNRLQAFAANREDSSIFAVVDWIELSIEVGEGPMAAEIDWTAENAVNILTAHSSKGLEFPVVFVVNLVTQRFPSRDRKEQIPLPQDIIREELPTGDENLQEERRLFYVAMTRARDQLYLTAARFYNEGKRERKLSPFVTEAIGDEIVSKIINKHNINEATEQLTLLEVLNTNHVKTEKKELLPPTATPLTYISYSQIKTFDTCALHYKLRYILKLPSPPTPAQSYGISIHSTLRDFLQTLKQDNKIKPDLVQELLKKNWIKQGYLSKAHEKKALGQANDILSSYAKNLLSNPPETIAIEMPFSFWLDKLKVGGRIDRIDSLSDERIEIIDYKTGNNLPTDKKVKEDMQLSFYALAATNVKDKIFNKPPDKILLTLFYIEFNQKFSTTRTKEELDIVKDKILKKVEEIQHSEFKCTGGVLCKNCEYKMICNSFQY